MTLYFLNSQIFVTELIFKGHSFFFQSNYKMLKRDSYESLIEWHYCS